VPAEGSIAMAGRNVPEFDGLILRTTRQHLGVGRVQCHAIHTRGMASESVQLEARRSVTDHDVRALRTHHLRPALGICY
jgi:hypothetical protein